MKAIKNFFLKLWNSIFKTGLSDIQKSDDNLIIKLWNFVFKTETGLYLVFGGLTTAVSIVVFWIFNNLVFDGSYVNVSTVLKHIAGIIFAYFTNRSYVFKSQASTKKAKVIEATLFVGTRIGTLVIDALLINLLKYTFGINENIGTVLTSVVVVVLNYIASKLYIFKTPSDQ